MLTSKLQLRDHHLKFESFDIRTVFSNILFTTESTSHSQGSTQIYRQQDHS